ncbi:major facilitator superfamily transporter multidrug resistance protein [Rutstroemia sp. NJR-2017a BVV2]|nr:major facilitator superfamily transporter multidrug resistance protein [Rutstroemia sp. NJR-2017a BVV2]
MNNDIAKLQHAVSKKEHNFEENSASSTADTDTSSVASDTHTIKAVSVDYLLPLTSCVRVPWAGEIYVIRDRKRRYIITLTDGNLQLENKVAAGGGSYWICINTNGWFGFRNSVSGMFMGHDGRSKFVCRALYHRSYESFSPRAHPDGGYWLMTLHGNTWRAMSIGDNEKELVEVDDNGTAWEFVKV